ncbi:sulfatase-like hydrolase/transferase [Pontixanthobacter sp.]|uniref:sulfatase-like hydrolase/transferase n=1 Tax=Pontixanthobacter sp. TaxID=2792078 RepID=UPI003C7E886A
MTQWFRFELFKEIPWRWLVFWLLVPNAAIILMWPVGGPAMTIPILFCSALALVASQLPWKAVRYVSLVIIFVILPSTYITSSFNISLINIFYADQYLNNLDMMRSADYVIALILMIIGLGVALRFGATTKKFVSKDQYIMAVVSILMLVNMDIYASSDTRGSYKARAPADEPIDSAVIQAGIHPATVSAQNLVVIIVESWGVPIAETDRQVDNRNWDTSILEPRYIAERGTSKYFGSTTNSEIREWCGVWADHLSFAFDGAHCLPEKFGESGFHTAAFHSFTGTFFNRDEWYVKLGFDQQVFREGLFDKGADACKGLFNGVCDADVPSIIGDYLRHSKSERNLVYWLTLNAHLPIAVDEKVGTDKCTLGPQQWRDDFPVLCRSYTVHKVLADSIFQEIMASDFPESDILIVGDHMPPFFPRAMRTRFDPGRVPWIYLKNRQAQERSVSEPSEAVKLTSISPRSALSKPTSLPGEQLRPISSSF